MKEKKVTLSTKGASIKQFSDLILELNLMKTKKEGMLFTASKTVNTYDKKTNYNQ